MHSFSLFSRYHSHISNQKMRCEVIVVDSIPPQLEKNSPNLLDLKQAIDDLPLSTPIGFIRLSPLVDTTVPIKRSRLFYIHKAISRCIEIKLTPAASKEFDECIHPTSLAKLLSDSQLEQARRITGYPRTLPLLDKENKENLNGAVKDVVEKRVMPFIGRGLYERDLRNTALTCKALRKGVGQYLMGRRQLDKKEVERRIRLTSKIKAEEDQLRRFNATHNEQKRRLRENRENEIRLLEGRLQELSSIQIEIQNQATGGQQQEREQDDHSTQRGSRKAVNEITPLLEVVRKEEVDEGEGVSVKRRYG